MLTPRRALRSLSPLLLGAAMALHGAPSLAAGPDGNIEWNGLSHVAWQDRRPLCPVGRESFKVRFQAYRDDLTAARVRVTDGAAVSWRDAAVVARRGPYDVWAATVPGAATDTVRYWMELTDGADTDFLSAAGVSDGAPTDGGWTVDFASLEHAPVGATPVSGGGAVFKVWAPTRTTAHVRGEFNGWGLGNPMTKVGEHFIARVAIVADRQAYKFYFNNSVWNTDPRARSLDPGSNLNARLENPFRYAWGDTAWATPDLAEMVVYQLHVGTFAGRNDPYGYAPTPAGYLDVAARVGHLAELGVNAVMLNPITEFPGDLSAGYNPQTAWAPEWKYGTPDQLKQLIDTLHRHGIAVLLDIVWNHFTYNDNFLWYYDGSQTYFDNPAVETPWGSQADFDRAAVRDYFADSALLWLEEYHVDGFRMDATSYMNIAPQEAAGWSLMQRFNDEQDRRYARAVTVAEQLPDNDWVTRPTGAGGAGFDAQYYDAFTDDLRQEIFDAATGDPEMWKIRNLVNGGGTYLSGSRVMNYLELHDEAWPASGGQRIVKTIDTTYPHDDEYARGRVKLAQGMVMLAPGVPAILQGSEWLEDTDFGAEGANKIDWSKKTTYAPIFQYFRDLIDLRRSWPAFRADSPWQVYHLNESGNVIAFRRSSPAGDPFVVVANFGNGDYPAYRLGLPLAGSWTEMLNSQAAAYGGSGPVNPGAIATEAVAADGYLQSAVLALPRMGLVVLGPQSVVEVPVGGPGPAPPRSLCLGPAVPSPARGATAMSFELPRAARVRLTVHDVRGRRVRTLVDDERAAGSHAARWDGHDEGGRPAPAGLYFLRLEAAGQSVTGRVVRLP